MMKKLFCFGSLAWALCACGGAESVGPATGEWGATVVCLEASRAPDATQVTVHVDADPAAAPADFGAEIAGLDLTVRDDGVAPDEVAADLVYTGRLDVAVAREGCEVVAGGSAIENAGAGIAQRHQAVYGGSCYYFYRRFLEKGCWNPSGCVVEICITIGPFEVN